MPRNFWTDQKLVVHVFGHQQMKCFLYILGSQCLSIVSILGNLSKEHSGLLHNLHILGLSTVIYIVPFLTTSSTNCFSFARIFCVSKFLALEESLGVAIKRSCLFFQVSNVDFFSGMSCPLIVIAYKLKRTEIRLTAIIPCGSSSFFISSSSMLSSSTHLMKFFFLNLTFDEGWIWLE